MNNPLDPSLRGLSACGCAAGTAIATPAAIDNRPGLPEVRFRAGVHSEFQATLHARLSSQDRPALLGLKARDADDFTIALLDAFACTADVLTFYSERLANEAYLRTATERRSLLELARCVGYELFPGVAAHVMLAFTVEGGRGTTGTAIIPKGTKVQSIPGPEEKPQVFETSLDFHGRAEWNELRPRSRAAPPKPRELPGAKQLYLAGTNTNVKRGDILILSSGTEATAKRIAEVLVDRVDNVTYVKFETNVPAAKPQSPAVSSAATPESATPIVSPAPRALTGRAIEDGREKLGVEPTREIVSDQFLTKGVSPSRLHELRHFHGWSATKVQDYLNSLPRVTLHSANAGVFALRVRAGFFGHNAPKWSSLPDELRGRGHAYPNDWDDLPSDMGPSRIWQNSQGTDLNRLAELGRTNPFDVLVERPIPEVVKGSWLVLETEDAMLVPLRVGRNSELSRADYAMSAKCARLNLKNVDGESDPSKNPSYTTRGTTIHFSSEPLEVLGEPIEVLPQGTWTFDLDRIDTSLTAEQWVAVKGEDANLPGTTQRELIIISPISHFGVTRVTLKSALQHSYLAATVRMNANVVAATHGETTREVLGNGDASQPFQKFTLKQKPLTHTFSVEGSSLQPSLELWIDDVRWREVSSFFESMPTDRVYVVRQANDGTVAVHFGDGIRGARLPTGRENVRAVYRKGIGVEGLVKEDQVSLMLTQPLGVTGVFNLFAPQGAENPQTLEDTRVNAPRAALTLDRVVSLQDYEDFARDFPGVAKAHAAWAWAGQTRGVLLTMLGPDGSVIDSLGPPAEPLRSALARQGISRVPVRIVSEPPSLFTLAGTVNVEANRDALQVGGEVKRALLGAFYFEAREFGQGVSLSEVLAVIQNVSGVEFISITDFHKTSLMSGQVATIDPENGYLAAHQPANGGSLLQARPAELLILNPTSLSQLEVISP